MLSCRCGDGAAVMRASSQKDREEMFPGLQETYTAQLPQLVRVVFFLRSLPCKLTYANLPASGRHAV